MKKIFNFITFVFLLSSTCFAMVSAGIGKSQITPSTGTPSAGYMERRGQGMQGTHDPLLAIALFISNGEKNIVLCSVDHLGFTYEMVQKITEKVQSNAALADCEIFIGSSHTHSGGGAHLNIPVLGEALAGAYNPSITQFYIEKTAQAILNAFQNRRPAKIGIGYGYADRLSHYRGQWPKNLQPLADLTLIKVTHLDDTPLALLFNYAVHPTVLTSQNFLFSADFVGFVREHLQSCFGAEMQAMYFNGAQGDIVPVIFNEKDRFDSCNQMAVSLSGTIKTIWDQTETNTSLQISTLKEYYVFKPQPTPFGLALPIEAYASEINAIVMNESHAFLTIPGELSTAYDQYLKGIGDKLGYANISIFGLTNDAHGYIILPASWRHKTFESSLSFGGENYGTFVVEIAEKLLKNLAPR
jgi:hypothetical protein